MLRVSRNHVPTTASFSPLRAPVAQQVEGPLASRFESPRAIGPVALAPPASAPVPVTQQQMDAMSKLDHDFADAFTRFDAVACAEMYRPDAVFTDFDGVRHEGRAAIQDAFEKIFQDFRNHGYDAYLEPVQSGATPKGDGVFDVDGWWNLTVVDPALDRSATRTVASQSTVVVENGDEKPVAQYAADEVHWSDSPPPPVPGGH